MTDRACFSSHQTGIATRAAKLAANLVTDYYRIAPREWMRMPYEVKTLRSLEASEVVDHALAHTLCYRYRREAGSMVLDEGELYRICLQDHRILTAADATNTRLSALLTYVLTHEFVHVVRFGQRLQSVELPSELRGDEESKVESTTRRILTKAGLSEIVSAFDESPALN